MNDIKTLLPVGEKFKTLLNKSNISDSNLNNILVSRGVLLGDTGRKSTIPLLARALISPKEFEVLQDFQKTKEDSIKIKTSKVHASTTENLSTIIPPELISLSDVTSDLTAYDFNTEVVFRVKSPNHMVMDYEIIRDDLSKDWVSTKSKFIGRVEVYKIDTGEISLKNEFTSSETEGINYKIIKKVVKHLKERGKLTTESSLNEITSDKLQNKERFSFMLQLSNDSESGNLGFELVKNIEIGPDQTVTIPGEGNWMQGNVKNIIINSESGQTLSNIVYISNSEYHSSLILRQMQSKYRFDFGSAKGTCIIEYGFPHFFRKNTKGRTFETSVAKIYFDKDSHSKSTITTSRLILSEFEKMYFSTFSKLLSQV